MIYAPIAITTLNRYEHLKRCIESLQANEWAKYTELYIGVDYPPSQRYEDGYKKVCEYLSTEPEGFAKVNIVFHETNLGPFDNWFALYNLLKQKHDCFIFSEDDNLFAPSYIEYMDKAFDKYKDYDDIYAIYGAHPLVKKNIPEGTAVLKVKDYSAYGTGFYVNKYDKVLSELNRSYIEKICEQRSILKKIEKANPRALLACTSALLRKEALYSPPSGEIPKIDMMLMIYFIVENKYMLCSTKSLVKNMGYDGTGVNCEDRSQNIMSTRVLFSECEYTDTMENMPEAYEYYRPMSFKTKIVTKFQVMGTYMKIYLWRWLTNRKVFR